MRWKISPLFLHFRRGPHPKFNPRGHDPRTIDVLAMIALLLITGLLALRRHRWAH